LFDRSDALTVRSLKNTEQALNYIGKVKLMGYVSSTVTGGISGGLLGGQLQSGGNPAIRFSWPGALAGAVGGCVIYYLFMKVID
jgi:outer membrane lipoprotein SlyB